MSQLYRVELGPFDPEARVWNVDLLSAHHVRVVALRQEAEPLLDQLWMHTVGSPKIIWKGGEDLPPAGLSALVELKLPKRASAGIVALAVMLLVSVGGVAQVYGKLSAAQATQEIYKKQSAELAHEAKLSRASVKSEQLRALAQELFTRGGENYAKR